MQSHGKPYSLSLPLFLAAILGLSSPAETPTCPATLDSRAQAQLFQRVLDEAAYVLYANAPGVGKDAESLALAKTLYLLPEIPPTGAPVLNEILLLPVVHQRKEMARDTNAGIDSMLKSLGIGGEPAGPWVSDDEESRLGLTPNGATLALERIARSILAQRLWGLGVASSSLVWQLAKVAHLPTPNRPSQEAARVYLGVVKKGPTGFHPAASWNPKNNFPTAFADQAPVPEGVATLSTVRPKDIQWHFDAVAGRSNKNAVSKTRGLGLAWYADTFYGYLTSENPVHVPACGANAKSETVFFEENFDDNLAEGILAEGGRWSVVGGALEADSRGGNRSAIAIFCADLSAADQLSFAAVVRTSASSTQGWKNGFLVFDYKNPMDFKYAGILDGRDQIGIGHFDGAFHELAQVAEPIQSGVDYPLRVAIDSNHVAVYSGDVLKVSHAFGSRLNRGCLGLLAAGAVTRFDSLRVTGTGARGAAAVPPLHFEDFDGGAAGAMSAVQGTWTVTSGEYRGRADASSAKKGNAVAVFPADLSEVSVYELRAVVNTSPQTWPRDSRNAFLIFDYRSPTDFKYAGALDGKNAWAIGAFDGEYRTLAQVTEAIATDRDYDLSLVVEGGTATLSADGKPKVSYPFPGGIPGGKAGVGAFAAQSEFDMVTLLTPAAHCRTGGQGGGP